MRLSGRERAREGKLRERLLASERRSPWPGIAACAALTWAAFYLHTLPFPPFTLRDDYHPLNAVLLALLLGLAIRNLAPAAARLRPGVDMVIKRVLPAGIVLLGARLDFYDLLRVGYRVLFGAVILIVVIIVATRYLCRFFSVKAEQGLLIGVGTAICGTSAIVATAPLVESKEEDIAISIASINLLGALAMVVFPFAGAFLLIDPQVYGEWCGLAIHATPQVIAAGFAHHLDGETAGEIATIVKLTRISLLGPAVFVIGAAYAYQRRKQAAFVGPPVDYARLVPTFVLFFVGMAFLRTAGMFPEMTFHMTDHMTERFLFGAGDRTIDMAYSLGEAGKWLITGAIAGVGLVTELRALRSGGVRPFLLGLASTAILALLALGYSYWL